VRTALLQDPVCNRHVMQPGHPECPERLTAVLARLRESGLADALVTDRPVRPATDETITRAHPANHLAVLERMVPAEGLRMVDGDTALCPDSLEAARHAAGAAVTAVEDVLAGYYDRAFCAVRPPGHHAESRLAMGFCFLNSVAIAALHALEAGGLERVAILDFDVHHGNGTVEILREDPRVLVCSSFQHPFYPNRMLEPVGEPVVLTPLSAGTGGAGFRRALERDWVPALERHRPELILVSAGFDGHRDDPLAELELLAEDYAWVTRLITTAAAAEAGGRVISLLEGGYDLRALADSVEAHVRGLLEAP
jgi:acetoin utilization deacetylase AcuC-like enzyme